MSDDEYDFEDNNDFGESEEKDEKDELEFVDEMGAWGAEGRVGRSAVELGTTKEKRAKQSPIERFITDITRITLQYNEDGVFNITDAELQEITEKTHYLPQIHFKNPMAYVLGFIASKGGTSITKKSVEKVFNMLPSIESSYGIKEPDVVRYARLWIKLKD